LVLNFYIIEVNKTFPGKRRGIEKVDDEGWIRDVASLCT
jgi:hypothetical protein